MNNEGDLYCTCDVGPFASCPMCVERERETSAIPTRKKKFKWETQSAEDRIAEIKAGWR